MSTSETVTLRAGDCQCGKGQVVKHVTTQDNPWSSADISYALDCATCAADWRLDRRQLVLRSSETAYADAKSRETECFKALRSVVDPLVDSYFTSFAASTKKAEHAEMQRLDLYVHSYDSFLKVKKEGKSPSQIAYGLRNPTWLRGLAAKTQVDDEFKELVSAWENAKAATSKAGAQIVRKSFT